MVQMRTSRSLGYLSSVLETWGGIDREGSLILINKVADLVIEVETEGIGSKKHRKFYFQAPTRQTLYKSVQKISVCRH